MVLRQAPLEVYPHECIASGRDDGEFIDTGRVFQMNNNFAGAHIYLAKGYVEQVAREHCGMVSAEEHDELRKRVEELTQKLGGLRSIKKLAKELDQLEQEAVSA